MKMKTTFVERANTNEAVYRKANELLSTNKPIKKLSNIYLERKQRFYCQVATANQDDPVRLATFREGTLITHDHRPRTRGRPKIKWAHTEAKKLWDNAQPTTVPAVKYNPRSETQSRTILELAKHKLASKRR